MLGDGGQSTRLSLIVCRSMSDRRVCSSAWIYAHALELTFAGYGPRRAGAKRITPTVPVSTAPMSVTSSEDREIRRLPWSRSWLDRWAWHLVICSTDVSLQSGRNVRFGVDPQIVGLREIERRIYLGNIIHKGEHFPGDRTAPTLGCGSGEAWGQRLGNLAAHPGTTAEHAGGTGIRR